MSDGVFVTTDEWDRIGKLCQKVADTIYENPTADEILIEFKRLTEELGIFII